MTVLSNLKLTYFAIPGRAESIRLALKIGGIPFEDIRIEFPQWKELKGDTPWGSLPYIELSDGTRVAQQRAILRLVDPIAAAKVDELCDVCDDFQSAVNKTGQGIEQAAKEAARKEAVETGNVATQLKTLDAFIAKNGSGGHAVSDKLTVADILIVATLCAVVCGIFDGVPESMCDPFENIKALMKNVVNHPKISGYLDEMKDEKFYCPFAKAK